MTQTPQTKTILEWLQELPDEYRDKAISNNQSSEKETEQRLSAALFRAFAWAETPEGYDYWWAVWSNLLKARQ